MKERDGIPRAKAAVTSRAGNMNINMIYLGYECKWEVVDRGYRGCGFGRSGDWWEVVGEK